VKLVVATLLLVAMALGAKLAIERIAPEESASASTRVTTPSRAKAEAGTVQSVRFSGPGLRAAFLSDVVATREGETFRPSSLEDDRIRILDAMLARGYLDATVGTPHVEWSASGAAWVDFPVDAGSLYVVRDVKVEGKQLRRHPALAEVPTLVTGNPALGDRIEASAQLLRDWLAQRGIKAKVTVTTALEKFSKQVDVAYIVE
jgi:outer membrane protein assembly factor BamA